MIVRRWWVSKSDLVFVECFGGFFETYGPALCNMVFRRTSYDIFFLYFFLHCVWGISCAEDGILVLRVCGFGKQAL